MPEKYDFSLERVYELIKNAEFSEAQRILDAIFDRNAEWHYLQSIIYHQNGWLMESKKELEKAKDLSDREEFNKLKNKYSASGESYKEDNSEKRRNKDIKTDKIKNHNCLNSDNGDDCCCECCGSLCLEGCCELICNGCDCG